MGNLFGDLLTETQPPYFAIYQSLQQVRAAFHREGRISDANAKLDETVKLLALHFGYLKGLVSDTDYTILSDRKNFKVGHLNRVFAQMAKEPIFQRRGIGSIFGDNPVTIFREGDEGIAFDLLMVARHAFGAQKDGKAEIDILNEAFGHHVRDNFRNHTEDAQYMTPPEIVNFMVDMGVEMIREYPVQAGATFVVADPSCGVGSFLTRWRTIYAQKFGKERSRTLKCVGQDKVDRMVRLSAVNFMFSENHGDDVFLGNTICDGSPISEYDGLVDIILTNPPFGARFSVDDLRINSRDSTPFYATALTRTKVVESEMLFLDRYLTLLKPGGICLTIVPDGVVSARGLGAIARQHLARNAEIVTIVELPTVTFAQAGTRTKTAILGFRKMKTRKSYPVFFSEVTDIGFQVNRRSGVPVKKIIGNNQLPEVLSSFRCRDVPGANMNDLTHGTWKYFAPCEQREWTPRRMIFDRESLRKSSMHRLVPLRELTKIPERRRTRRYTDDVYFIGVLHIIGEGVLDVSGIKRYQPITPGFPVEAGEVLVSRINPRIPRVAVVPDLGRGLLCSSEYEILKARDGVSPYALAFVLLSRFVQEQIRSLTAGTSASHSRIKPEQIYDVLVPDLDYQADGGMVRKLRRYEECCRMITKALVEIEDLRSAEYVERGTGRSLRSAVALSAGPSER